MVKMKVVNIVTFKKFQIIIIYKIFSKMAEFYYPKMAGLR